MFRLRTLPECNYRGLYRDGKTIRIALDPTKPITELSWPEFYDVKITDFCQGACPWCYQDSTSTGRHVPDALAKIDAIFGAMEPTTVYTDDFRHLDPIQPTPANGIRPFQVALGGGNPNEHPDFIHILDQFRHLGIVPNYTTNGMGVTDEVLEATKHFCGGVAVSCHPHLQYDWEQAVDMFADSGIKLNLHVIISDLRSVFAFDRILSDYASRVDHIVALPYSPQGRAPVIHTAFPEFFRYLAEMVAPAGLLNKVAYGAGFHEALKAEPWIKASLYEPEAMSKYIDLGNMTMYPSSFMLDKPLKMLG
jgi:hypothetical protein